MINADVIREVEQNVKNAWDIYNDLSGTKKQGGLSLSTYGKYIVVDDGSDRWLCEYDEFQEGLDSILKSALDGKYDDDDRADARCDAYDDLCGECPAIYSRIGMGEYNSDTDELRVMLEQSLDTSVVDEIFEELGIEVDNDE